MRRYLLWPKSLAAIALLVFLVATLALDVMVPDLLAGGAMYLPTAAACLFIVAAPTHTDPHVRRLIAAAAGLFLLGFTLRSLDAPLCDALPIGTHYFWHLSNATVLYLLVRAAILHGRARQARLRAA